MASLFAALLLIALPALSWAQSIPAMTWGSGVNVSNTSGRPSTFPKVAASGDTVHAIWWDNDSGAQPGSAYYKRSLDGGVTWQDQYILSTALSVDATAIVTSGSKVVAFWTDQVSGQYIVRSARSTDAGATWSAPQDISPSLGTALVRAEAGSGQMVVLWAEVSGSAASLKVRLSTDDGQTWGSTLNVPTFNFDPSEGLSADVAIAGSVMVVGYIESPFAVRAVRSADWGQNWSSPALVYSDPSHPMHTLHLAAYGSSAVMRWERFFGSYNDEAMAAASADGGVSWSTPTSLSSGISGSNADGDICIYGSRAVTIWLNNPAPGATDFPLYYRRSLDGGQTWEPATVIPTGLYRFDVPKCATTPNSVYIVGYAGSGSTDIYLFRGQAWGADLRIEGKIVFHSNRDGNLEIYSMNADGTGATRLTNNLVDDVVSGRSPDGTKVAFVSDRDGNNEIYVMNADGSAQIRLTNNPVYDGQASWSPDGSKIVFMSYRDDAMGEIYVMNVDGTGVTRLTNSPTEDYSPAWSPDGTRIAYASRSGSNGDIYLMNPDGSNQTPLTTAPGTDASPAWSPDGSKILFYSDRDGQGEVYIMDANGSNQVRLTNNPAADYSAGVNAWSPEGTKLLMNTNRDGNLEIYVMNPDGSNPTRLTSNSDFDGGGAWTPFQHIGSAAITASVSRTMTVQNKGDATLTVSNITSSDGQFTVSPTSFSLAPGSSQNVTVTFTPASAGVKYSTLTITSDDADTPTAKLMVNGTGQAPDLEISGKIAFYSTRDGNQEIYTMNADGSTQTRLTNNGAGDANPALSPDGTKIAFPSNRDGNWEIYVMNADGTGQTRLTNNPANEVGCAWSPDGTKIIFSSDRDGNWEVYVMSADGSGQTNLTNNSAYDVGYAWSPDGTKIAFRADRNGNGEIYVMNADGSGQTNLTNNSALEGNPAWSPEGTKIAFTSNRDGNDEIYAMNADGSAQIRLTNSSGVDGASSWSPDGTKIAFSSERDGNAEIYVMNADGSSQTRLTNNSAEDAMAPGSWGEAFRRIGSAAVGTPVSRTMTIKNRGDATLNVTNITSSDGQFTLSPTSFSLATGSSQSVTATFTPTSAGVKYSTLTITSNDATAPTAKLMVNGTGTGGPDLQISGKIAFTSNRDGNNEVYVMNADGTAQTRLTNTAAAEYEPSWSADGSKVAFSSNRDGNSEIYVMNADGAAQTNLTNNAANDGSPSWSADGNKIAFSTNRDGNFEIYAMNADGTGLIRLTNNPASDGSPSWSPDGSKFAFQTNRDGNDEIYAMNADGTNSIRLTNNSAGDYRPSWSPDGAKIVFHSTRNNPNGEIYVMNADGTGQTRPTTNATGEEVPSWSPDGTKIVFRDYRHGASQIYAMNADGTGQTRLTTGGASDAAPFWELFRRIGSATVGSSTSRTMTIENKGSATLNVSNITSSDGQFALSPTSFSVAAGASQNVTVTFTPTSTGVKYSTLTITSNDATAPTASLKVNGTGAPPPAPSISLSTTSLSFGSVEKGQSAQQTFRIKSIGTAPLTVSGLSRDTNQFNVSPTVPPDLSINAGDSAAVTVTFSPTSIGAKADTVRITHGATGSPAKVALVGTGADTTRPAVPASLAATSGNTQATLNWTANTEGDLSHYVVYRSTTNNFTPAGTDSVARVNKPTITYTGTGLSAGTYYFKLAAVDSAGNKSAFSIQVSAVIEPHIAVSPTALNFGNARTGTTRIQTFAVSNTGTDTLKVSALPLSGIDAGRFTCSPSSFSVAPGAAAQVVSVTFSPTVGSQSATPKSAVLSFTDNAPEAPQLSLSGIATAPAITISPSPLGFGSVTIGQSATSQLTVANAGTDTLKVTDLALSGSNADQFPLVAGQGNPRYTIAPNASQVISVPFAPTSEGTKSATLTLTHNAAPTGTSTAVLLSGAGSSFPVPTLVPHPAAFGSVKVGQNRLLALTVINNSTEVLLVSRITANDSAFTVFPDSLSVPAKNSTHVMITFAPMDRFPKDATLTLSYTTSSGPASVTATLTGQGTQPVIAVLDSLRFGDVNIETEQRRTLPLTIYNTGNDTLVLSEMTRPTGVFSATPTMPSAISLRGGDSTRVNVTFAPTSVRADTASVTIRSNAANAPSVRVGLSGRGTLVGLVVRPDTLDFGRVRLDSVGTRTLTVSNPGNLRLAIGSMASSNPRFSAPPGTFTVNGGDSARVAVSFAPVQKGAETGTLTLSGNAQREKVVVLRGLGARPEIAVFPDSLDFLEVVMPGTGVLPLQVSNPGTVTLRVTRVNRDNLRFAASDSIFVLPPDSAKNLTVVFAPAQPDRVELGRLVLTTNAGNKEVRVRGRGIESAWRVSPNPLAFGRVRMDSSRSLSVSILNTGQARVTIDSLAVVNGEGIVELTRLELPPSIAAGARADVATVRFAPRVLGNLSGVTLRVKEGEIVQLVQVQGTGFSPPDMVVTPDSLTLGPVALGGVKTGALEIRNAGGDTLHLNQLRSDQEVFSAAPAKLTLAPGASGTVNISFRPAAEGEVRARLLYSSDDPSPPQIKLSGSGIPLPAILSFSPADTLRFGVVSLGWSELQPLVIRNRGRGTLKAVLRSESGEFAPEQSDTLRIAAQDSMQALIRFIPAQPGHRFGNLLIASNDLQVPLARLVMRGEGGGLRLEPPAINFGEVVVGSRVDTAIQVINQSAGQWTISLSATSPGFGINPPALRLEPGTSGRVQVWFQPTAKEDYQGEIKVQDRPLLNVTLSGIGAEGPDIEVSPSLDFGEVAVGTAGEGTLTVKNTGRGPLRIFDLSSSRLEYRVAQEDSLPLVIPSGGDHLLQVSFTPDTTGEVRGSLTIASNDPDEQEVVRLLNGRGRGLRPPPPCIAVAIGEQEEELYFGPLEAGEERELPLVVRNDCQGVLRVERIEADSRQVVANPESLAVTAGESRRVGVRLRAGLGEAQEGVVRLVSNDPDHPVVRRRWYYTPERPCAEVLTEQLRFGPAEGGQRTALLAISNPCSARLLVDLVDEERQLTFAEERLVVEPEQLERVRVSYAGSGGSGQVVLATNDPARRQVTIPWEAQPPLQVRSALPREGVAGVSRQTTAQLEFSQALRQVVKGLASVQLHILPEPLNNWRRQARVEDYILSIPLELAAGTSYRLVVVEAEAQSGARLAAPFELHFSTAAQALAVGSIAGRVLFDDGSAVVGTVFLANMQKELVGSARITRDGSFTLSKVPEGRYQLFAQEKATGLSTAYEQEVEVRAGQVTDGVDLVLPAQQSIEEKMIVLSGEVIVEEAPELLADSTFAVPIHTRGVQDLSGFAIQVSFDPEEVALVEVLPDSPTEKNVLYSAGGFPMFLSLVRDAGNMEFGGSLLGPAALQAPDGDGLLAYFVFRALRDPTEVEVVQVRRRTLRGEDVVSGGTIRPRKGMVTDFTGDGKVDFDDFFHFADNFGKSAQGEVAACDLDKSGTVDFSDFFIFADDFGKTGGSVAKLLALAQEILGLPASPQLEQSHPNPFNAQTAIRYQLAVPGRVKLAVYDLLGQQVRTLVEEVKEGGAYQVVWDGRDRAGNTVASGVYLYRLEAGPFRAVRKMVLVR